MTSPTPGLRFRGVMTLEGVPTSDKRIIAANDATWRDLPLTLMAMTKASHGGAPTTETAYAGAIDLIERRPVDGTPGAYELYMEGFFDTGEVGVETARLVAAKVLRGVSIDFAADEDLEVLEEDDDGMPVDYLLHYSNVEIGMATVCPFPAFAGGYIELLDEPAETADPDAVLLDVDAASNLPGLTTRPCEACGDRHEQIVAAGGPVDPPPGWFTDPELTGPTPLTVTDNGRVFGHLALWDTCHVGITGQCVTPPRSASGYAYFRVGSTRLADGTRVPTGALFMDTSHAATRGGLGASAVQDHYADTGTATADVTAGEDEHGVWVAGALRPGLTAEQVRVAAGSSLSGDWRTIGGRLELVAALHVNVPGFPVPHASLAASAGQPVALVAAGAARAAALPRPDRQGAADLTSIVRAELSRALAPLLAPHVAARRQAARDRLAAAGPVGESERQRQAARARVGR